MKFNRQTGSVLVAIFTLLCASCAGSIKSTGELEAGWLSMRPIPARVLLVIPEDFDRFVLVHGSAGATRPLPLGRQAADQLDRLFGTAFTSSAVTMVDTEAEARDRISREDPEWRDYDTVALPRFQGARSWSRGVEHGFEVDVVLELSSFATGRMEIIRGHGEATAPVQAGASAEPLAQSALSYAIDAIKDGLESRRAALSR